jgi:hypothetical protein
VSLTQYNPTRKENKVAQKKETKKIKVRDLKPKKDAKGGVAANVSTNVGTSIHSTQRQQNNVRSPHC